MIGTKLQDSSASLALTTVRVVAPSHLVYGKSSALDSPYRSSTLFSSSSDTSIDPIRRIDLLQVFDCNREDEVRFARLSVVCPNTAREEVREHVGDLEVIKVHISAAG